MPHPRGTSLKKKQTVPERILRQLITSNTMILKDVLPHAVAINEISPLGLGTYKFVNCPEEFGQFFSFPRFKENVIVYKNNGIVDGFKGEVYSSPMSAKDTYRRVSLKVSKGELVWNAHRNFKSVLSEPDYTEIPIVRY